MLDTYSSQEVEEFRRKIADIRDYEEINIKMESKLFYKTTNSAVIRTIYLAAYEHILKMFDQHFKIETETSKVGDQQIVNSEIKYIEIEEIPDDFDDDKKGFTLKI